ncbi:class I SAM-dependent rRNA methyltransferase [candidate division WOR-3 bacterium]|nr:class I SAM-dependent rRNA methyltransferase [candidate division WOR-3 bacterium]
MVQIKIKYKAQKKIICGYPWVWDNEVESISGSPEPGSVVTILDSNGIFLGKGFYNPASSIRVRIVTEFDEPIDFSFVKKRISSAWTRRKIMFPEEKCLRAFFSESDGIPGLVIDVYDGAVVIQLTALGAQILKPDIIKSIDEIFNPSFIVERSDSPVRLKEGLEPFKGLISGVFESGKIVKINGVCFSLDLLNSQKTGFFLDQRENYTLLSGISKGKKVLDAFCNIGAFGIHAALYGADKVVFLDCSKKALDSAEKNYRLNSLGSSAEFVKADAVSFLKKMQGRGEKFDVIILDPPAFVKDRKKLKQGIKGYKEINMRAMDMLNENGFLISCSCSQHLEIYSFLNMLKSAAADRRVEFSLLSLAFQPKDHPSILPMEDFPYLKCVLLEKKGFNNRIFP